MFLSTFYGRLSYKQEFISEIRENIIFLFLYFTRVYTKDSQLDISLVKKKSFINTGAGRKNMSVLFKYFNFPYTNLEIKAIYCAGLSLNTFRT